MKDISIRYRVPDARLAIYVEDARCVIITSRLIGDKKIELTIQFLLHPNLPVIRKNPVIKNLASTTMKLESIDVEKFDLTPYWATTFSSICPDYGRRFISSYDGNVQDALITVHNADRQIFRFIINTLITFLLKQMSEV